MTQLTDTIAGRTIIVLVFGLGASLFLAQYLYQTAREKEIRNLNANQIAERLLVLAQTITAISLDNRDETAHSLSGGPLELHWSKQPLATPGGQMDTTAATLQKFLLNRSPELASRGLIIGAIRDVNKAHITTAPNDPKHFTLISLGLEDGSWLNVTLAQVQPTQFTSPSFAISTLVGTLCVLLVAIFLGRWLTKPLNQLAIGARHLNLTNDVDKSLAETGTREVRTLASAINEMHFRIKRMVKDRTQMLAAISHDLRTPLTRLRLRANAISDHSLKDSINRDIDEMEKMVVAVLGFVREDIVREEIQPIDLSAILQTIKDDAVDAGQIVNVNAPRSLVCNGRHLALKRALTNLIDNAIKYGGSATISARELKTGFTITISDKGPGIPSEKFESVFAPFHQLDDARQKKKNGFGLGLTVARSIIRGHGGELELANRKEGGLEVRMHLPNECVSAN